MSLKIDMSPELEKRINAVIDAVREKQQERKLELYNNEMKEMLSSYNEYDLLLTGCRIVRSPWKDYIILPENVIDDKYAQILKNKMAVSIMKKES